MTHKCKSCSKQIPLRYSVCLTCKDANDMIVDRNNLDPRKIKELNLPKGIQDAIIHHTIFTIGELRRTALNRDLTKIHGIGPEKAAIIADALAKAYIH